MRSCGRSRRTPSCGPRSPPSRCSTVWSTPSGSATRSSGRAARSPACASGRRQPLLARPTPVGGRSELRPRVPPASRAAPAARRRRRTSSSWPSGWGCRASTGPDRCGRCTWSTAWPRGAGPHPEAPPRHHRWRRLHPDRPACSTSSASRRPGLPPDAPDVDVLGSVDRLVDAAPTSGGAGSARSSATFGAVTGNLRGVLADPVGAGRASSRTPSAPSAASSPRPPSSSAR